jgi:nucleolysin TIA-1/TIAR
LYAFVEFAEHRDAQLALAAMNKRIVLGREMKVNWATSPGSASKQDTSKHFHVFVGDISPDIESHQLKEAFSPFGVISDCKVIRDPQTHKSRGYGFVCYVNKEDAEMAIAGMNGQWLGGRPLRTNWATGKGTTTSTPTQKSRRELDYDDVYNQTGPTNSTVYVGGIQSELTDELMREHFSQFGQVQDVRIFKDKGYAFVRMDSKDSATRAIIAVHGSQINGYTVKSSWGKDMASDGGSSSSSSTPSQPSMPQQGQYNYASNMQYYNYWGGYGMPGNVPPAAQGQYGMPYYGGYPQYGQQQQMQWPGAQNQAGGQSHNQNNGDN